MIRIPASRGKGTRIEVRSVDPSANPYLAISVLLASGIDGIKSNLTAPNPIKMNLIDLNDAQRKDMKIEYLPDSLKNAKNIFSKSDFMKEVIGENLHKKLIEAKTKEWIEYNQSVSEWK